MPDHDRALQSESRDQIEGRLGLESQGMLAAIAAEAVARTIEDGGPKLPRQSVHDGTKVLDRSG